MHILTRRQCHKVYHLLETWNLAITCTSRHAQCFGFRWLLRSGEHSSTSAFSTGRSLTSAESAQRTPFKILHAPERRRFSRPQLSGEQSAHSECFNTAKFIMGISGFSSSAPLPRSPCMFWQNGIPMARSSYLACPSSFPLPVPFHPRQPSSTPYFALSHGSYATWSILGFIFNHLIKRRHPAWWAKYKFSPSSSDLMIATSRAPVSTADLPSHWL